MCGLVALCIASALSAPLARGAELTHPAATKWSETRFDVFARAADGQIYHKYWDAGQGADVGGWTYWSSMGAPPGGATSAPSATSGAPGRIDLVVRGADGRLWHNYYANYGGSWSGWGAIQIRRSRHLRRP